jgi:hypothetical protein
MPFLEKFDKKNQKSLLLITFKNQISSFILLAANIISESLHENYNIEEKNSKTT